MTREIPQKNPVVRENFGDKALGEFAYKTILQGAVCGVILDFNKKGDDGKALKCGKEAVGTLDFDAPFTRDIDLIPVCSDAHWNLAAGQLTEEYEKNNWFVSSFGRNGRGRA